MQSLGKRHFDHIGPFALKIYSPDQMHQQSTAEDDEPKPSQTQGEDGSSIKPSKRRRGSDELRAQLQPDSSFVNAAAGFRFELNNAAPPASFASVPSLHGQQHDSPQPAFLPPRLQAVSATSADESQLSAFPSMPLGMMSQGLQDGIASLGAPDMSGASATGGLTTHSLLRDPDQMLSPEALLRARAAAGLLMDPSAGRHPHALLPEPLPPSARLGQGDLDKPDAASLLSTLQQRRELLAAASGGSNQSMFNLPMGSLSQSLLRQYQQDPMASMRADPSGSLGASHDDTMSSLLRSSHAQSLHAGDPSVDSVALSRQQALLDALNMSQSGLSASLHATRHAQRPQENNTAALLSSAYSSLGHPIDELAATLQARHMTNQLQGGASSLLAGQLRADMLGSLAQDPNSAMAGLGMNNPLLREASSSAEDPLGRHQRKRPPSNLPLQTADISEEGRSAAAASHQPDASTFNQSSGRTVIPLATDEDENWLSEFLCFVRSECVEVFTAGPEDVKSRLNSKKVKENQVGIRCRFCAELPHRDRAGRSSSFPSSLSRIYQSLTMMIRDHFIKCSEMPMKLKERYQTLKSTTSQGATDSKRYWVDSALKLGLVDTQDGIFFVPSSSQGPMMLQSSAVAGETASSSGSNVLHDGSGASMAIMPQASVAASPLSASSSPGANAAMLPTEDKDVSSSDISGQAKATLVVRPEDEDLVSRYLFTLMSQVHLIALKESERVGNRRNMEVGLPGLGCLHCSSRGGLGRLFPARRRTLPTKVKDIHSHIMRCSLCPATIKTTLATLVRTEEQSEDQEKNKIFFDRVWSRMHARCLGPESGPMDHSIQT